MRFDDMVLKGYDVGRDYGLPTAEAQHEADMGTEVACPCSCHREAPHVSWCAGDCEACSGTGRVKLGALVAADRARKAVP